MRPASDLEISLWKQENRKEAETYLKRLMETNISPEERSIALNRLINSVSNVNDPAVTDFYAREISKRKILKRKDFIERVKRVCLEEPQTKNAEAKSNNPNHIAKEINLTHKIICVNGEFYIYANGVYKRTSKGELSSLIKLYTGDNYGTYLLKEVIAALEADTFKRPEEINQNINLLNVKNGMLDLESQELTLHNHINLSTIQIPCSYDPEAKCPKWLAFLEQMLGDDAFKIDTLQEFFGYCLTPLTNQEKAILLVGEGANGKSKILDILQGLVGPNNTSVVPLEQFKNPHYLAEFFESMVNISYESNTKTQVYEATFKQLTSGEAIPADRKYGHPFKFKNTCKLIFSFNNMPHVDDTTDAFYRRIIPIPCNVQISEEAQNKNLSKELLEELPGILNWALYGLSRLREQKKFTESPQSRAFLESYRKDNNNVISFVDESCMLDLMVSTTKEELYRAYKTFCDSNGYIALAIRKFGKRVRKYCPSVFDDSATDNVKIWRGIRAKGLE